MNQQAPSSDPLLKIPPSLQSLLVSKNVGEMMMTPIKSDRHWLTTQALPDVYDHIRAVRDEFTGSPEIIFYHAALIIKIRRHVDLEESFNAFRSLWNAEAINLLKRLNSRWIISALDTFADNGTPIEQIAAMAVAGFYNVLKMADTEYKLTGHKNYDAACLQDNIDNYPVVWDGVRVFHLPDDDTFANTVKRMRKVLAPTPLFMLIFELLLNKVMLEDTLLTRLAKHHLRKMW